MIQKVQYNFRCFDNSIVKIQGDLNSEIQSSIGVEVSINKELCTNNPEDAPFCVTSNKV